ncbi:MAG: tyrosine-type recombinase/integrase [Candidatus Korarchaeota archaeon]|nr:tyrosine-type recombinase/integrase [Candidatus Korarchaeota archaeon]
MGKPTSESRELKVREFMNEFPENLRKIMNRFFLERGLTSPSTRYAYVIAFRVFIKHMKKNPLDSNEEDWRNFYEEMIEKGLSENTLKTYLSYSKAFFRWYRPNDNPLAWWKSRGGRKRREAAMRDKILTKEEIELLVKAATRPLTKAIIAVMYEAALRVGELCSLRMRDLEHTAYGYKIRVYGKTGERTLPLINSAPYLREWLLVHPSPNDPNAPLFCKMGREGRIERLSETSINGSLRYVVKKAGLKKKVHPHMLRHTRLTELASKMTEQELKIFAGWTQDSGMASVYVHLSGRDAEKAVLKAYGFEEAVREEEERIMTLRPRVCPNCGYINPKDAKFCLKCGYPLGEEAVRELENAERSIDKILEAVLNDSKFKEALIKKLRELTSDQEV